MLAEQICKVCNWAIPSHDLEISVGFFRDFETHFISGVGIGGDVAAQPQFNFLIAIRLGRSGNLKDSRSHGLIRLPGYIVLH